MSGLDKEEFKQQLINSIESIQKGTGCDEGFSYTCFGEDDLEQALKIIEELETYKKIAEKLAEDKIIPKCKNCSDEDTHECTECALDWARKEVENDTTK